jgi:hypothetical protein
MLLVTNIGRLPNKYIFGHVINQKIYVKDYKFQCETKKIHENDENHCILIFLNESFLYWENFNAFHSLIL